VSGTHGPDVEEKKRKNISVNRLGRGYTWSMRMNYRYVILLFRRGSEKEAKR